METELLVDDGDTVVLGGIFTVKDEQSVSGTPFLSDLPVVGQLFRRDFQQTNKTELLIFITPSVVVQPKLNESEAKFLADAVFDKPTETYTKLGDEAKEKEAKEAEEAEAEEVK